MLQEEVNSSQDSDGEMHDCVVEDAKPESHCAIKATQVKYDVIQDLVF